MDSHLVKSLILPNAGTYHMSDGKVMATYHIRMPWPIPIGTVCFMGRGTDTTKQFAFVRGIVRYKNCDQLELTGPTFNSKKSFAITSNRLKVEMIPPPDEIVVNEQLRLFWEWEVKIRMMWKQIKYSSKLKNRDPIILSIDADSKILR